MSFPSNAHRSWKENNGPSPSTAEPCPAPLTGCGPRGGLAVIFSFRRLAALEGGVVYFVSKFPPSFVRKLTLLGEIPSQSYYTYPRQKQQINHKTMFYFFKSVQDETKKVRFRPLPNQKTSAGQPINPDLNCQGPSDIRKNFPLGTIYVSDVCELRASPYLLT